MMKKKVIALLLTASMCAALLAGCGSGEDSKSSTSTDSTAKAGETASSEEAEKEDPYAEHRDISVWIQTDDYIYYTSYDDNPVTTYLNDKFNMTLTFQQPAQGSESEQFSLMIGTGDYTDVINMAYSQDTAESLLNQGVIQDLTPYEQYMPNYIAYLNEEGNEQIKDIAYSGDGRLTSILIVDAAPGTQWGGLLYRRDILETMTDGNVEFPSGNEEPTTVDDWEYMLELMKQYFENQGLTDYACLILPAIGYVGANGAQIVGGFGASGTYHLEDGEVVFGPVTENFYNYLVKMHEWYEKGYIYQDFASRTQDMFFLPNTALTYGGAAGIWYGLSAQLGDAMSMPEYGLEVDVRALASPLDTEHGITAEDASFSFDSGRAGEHTAFCITSACTEENLIRYMQAMDYLYTEEGSLVRTIGLTAEQANGNAVYEAAGIDGGTYSVNEDGTLCFDYGWDYNQESSDFADGLRFPGIYRNDILTEYFTDDINKQAEEIWTQYGREKVYPFSLTPSAEDSDRIAPIYTNMFDYINAEVPKFIMGTNELNETTFQAYVDQIYALGLEDYLSVYQNLYEEYIEKYGN